MSISTIVLWNNGKAYFFAGESYLRYDVASDKADPNYPKPIDRNWPSLWKEGVNAGVNCGNGKAYFFRGSEFVRYDLSSDKVDSPPTSIASGWPGLWPDGIGTVIRLDDGKLCFFKGKECIRYDLASRKPDPGYPRKITSDWPGILFDHFDAAVNWGNGKTFFFQDQFYIRYNNAMRCTDPEYPKMISAGWPGVLIDAKFVQGFRPSVNGFHFSNRSFVSVPAVNINVAGTSIPLGNASNGMCGGMAFAVRDYFEARLALPPDTDAPAAGPLFDYLSNRLMDSLNIPTAIERYLRLMHPGLPDHETDMSKAGLAPRGRAWVMIREEWPEIQKDILAGRLSPIAVIKIKSLNPLDMGKNHVVLVHGYELFWPRLTLHLYDPNDNNIDTSFLQLNIDQPEHTTAVTGTVGTVYCFFRLGYSFKTPSFRGHPWPSLGGYCHGPFALASDSDQNLRLAAVGRDGELYLKEATSANNSAAWTIWHLLGGATEVAFGHNRDGRLEVFYTAMGSSVFRAKQLSAGAEPNFEAVGVPLLTNASHLRIGHNRGGRMVCFALVGNLIGYFWQTQANQESWSQSGFLQGAYTDFSVETHADGRMQLFGIGADGFVYHLWQKDPETDAQWTAPSRLLDRKARKIQAFRDTYRGDRIEVYILDTEGAVYQTAQTLDWSPWQRIGSALGKDLAIAQNGDGRVELFLIGNDDRVYHAWQDASGKWGAWYPFRTSPSCTSIRAARTSDKRIEVIVAGTDHLMYHNWQLQPGGGWTVE